MPIGPGRPAYDAQMADPFGEVGVPDPRQSLAAAQVPGMGLGAGAMPGHADQVEAERVRRAKLRKLADMRSRGMDAPDAQVLDEDVYAPGLTESLYAGQFPEPAPMGPGMARLPRDFP